MDDPVEVKVIPPEPHSAKQRLIMNAFRIPRLKKIYVACGTKFGKSISASACEATIALERPGTTWRWIAPIYDQARIGMDYFKKMLPPKPHTRFRDGAMEVLLPKVKSKIEFWHCKNPVSLEGAGIHGNIFDEAAKCPYDAVASAQTTVSFTFGPQMYISTPFGKNWFHRECMEAKAEMEWALKNGRKPTRVFINARTIDNPFVDPQVIKQARRDLPERLFRQFYLAEFIDDGQTFLGFRECIQGPEIEAFGAVQHWVSEKAKETEVIIGIDWAKKSDYTVMTAMDPQKGRPVLVGFMRFQGLGYVEALKELYNFAKKFKNVIIIKHDRTGVGEAIDDMLAQLGIPFEGVIFTNSSKSAMVNQLMMSFQTRSIELCNWPEMIKELEVYSVVTNDLGNARYSAPSGMHDDIVSSLMLANSAAQEYSSDFTLHFLEDLPKKKQTVESWYNDLIDDLD